MLKDLIKKVLLEATSDSVTNDSFVPPFRRGLKKWNKTNLDPFNEKISFKTNPNKHYEDISDKRDSFVTEWIEINDNILNEDLAVWFGKKKKPKGSKQPKGPWVNICRKVDGKHPPCGRTDTDKGGYPKCRAAGVAGKMTDSEKKSACQQKRRAEKKDTQTGKGQKPVMTSYKPKKKS
jgi:hypothetical protein